MPRIWGADISIWQGEISDVQFASFKRAGGEFIISKASQADFQDPWFKSHIAGMKRTGIIPGAYHYLTNSGLKHARTASGAEQARNFVETIRAVVPSMDVICAVDVEALGSGSEASVYPSEWDLITFINEFHRRQPGRPLWVYIIGSNVYNYITKHKDEISKPINLWIADWTGMRDVWMKEVDATDYQPQWWEGRSYGGKHPSIRQWANDNHQFATNWHGLGDADIFDGTAAELVAAIQLGATDGGGSGGDGCPEGYHRSASGVCVPIVPVGPDGNCPSGYHKDESGICVPDQSQTEDAIAAMGIAGSSGALMIGAAIAAVGAATYLAWKAGGQSEAVVDRGEKE